MDTITAEEWRKKHKDFKSIINGQRYMLKYIEGSGTCLVPVEVIGMRSIKSKKPGGK